MLLSEQPMAAEESGGTSRRARRRPEQPVAPLAPVGTDPVTTATHGGFRAWRRGRPAIGGLLVVLAGIEMFFSGQLDFGRLHIQLGIEGLQATVIPVALVLLGVLAVLMPTHHVFYGVLALAVALYSLIGVNLGGFLVGMILACVGGVLVVAWMPPRSASAPSPGEKDVA